MALPGDQTPPRPPAALPPAPAPADSGIDLTTLVLSAVASAAAAYVTSKIWAPGTLVSAAMSPVIVALVKEGLRKPTEVMTAAVPAVARPLRGRTGYTQNIPAAPPAPVPSESPVAGPVRVYSTRGRRLRWRLAVVTGLLGFVLCVAAYTVPEIIAGKSVSRSGHATTFFSGKAKKHAKRTTTTTGTTTSKTTTAPSKTATEPAQTVTQTVTTPAEPPATETATTPAATVPETTTTDPAPTPEAPAATTP